MERILHPCPHPSHNRDRDGRLYVIFNWITGCPDIWLNTISGLVCEGVSGPDEHVTGGLGEADHLPSVGGHPPVPRGPEQNKRQRKGEFFLCPTV